MDFDEDGQLSILITFFLGIFAAWGVMSIKNRLWRFVWDGILTLPLVLPPTVADFSCSIYSGSSARWGSSFWIISA